MSAVQKTDLLVTDIHGRTLPTAHDDFVSIVLAPKIHPNEYSVTTRTPSQALKNLRLAIESLEQAEVELDRYPGRPLLVVRGPSQAVRGILDLERISVLIKNFEIESMAFTA